MALPRTRGKPHTCQLLEGRIHPVGSAQHRNLPCCGHIAPAGQKPPKGGLGDWLCLGARCRQRAGADGAQHFGGDEFFFLHSLTEVPRNDLVRCNKTRQRLVRSPNGKAERCCQLAQREWAASTHPTANKLRQRIRDRLHLGWHARRNWHAETVAKQWRIKNLGHMIAPANTHPHHACRPECLLQRVKWHRCIRAELIYRYRTDDAQRVGELLGCLCSPYSP